MVSPPRNVGFGALKGCEGRAKVRREEAENVDKGRLELEQFLGALLGVDEREVDVPPPVAGDLVALAVHASDDVGVRVGENPSLSVFAVEKKGRLDSVSAENIE